MKKRLILTTICLTIIVGLIVPAFASAQIFPSASEIASSMVNYVMGVSIDLSANFAQIAGSLLDWVIGPDFISFSYTNPAGDNANPIVAVGLDITKNFVNLGLVIALIFIAISVSLQIGEYGTKKTFIKLIVVAILVNFVPVIVGLIVDAANITMNFFLNGIRNDISGALTDINNESLIGALTRPGTVKPFSLLVKGAVLTWLYVSLGFAFLLMVFIFVLRYIAIWILVILGPLAFVAWILPSTKRLWDMWWKQLFQWSFIGIPMAFFLYLAASAVPVIKSRFESQVVIPGVEKSIVGVVDETFPYFVIVAFIYIGFFISLKATAFGSSGAIRAAQKLPDYAWRGTKSVARSGLWIGKKAKLDQRRIGGARGKSVRELAGVIVEKIQHIPGARWALSRSVRKYAEYWPAVKKAQAEAAEHSTQTVVRRLYSKADVHEQALGNILHVLDSTDSQVIFDEAKKGHIGKRIAKEKGIAQLAVTDEDILNDEKWNKIMARPLQIALQSGKLETDILRKDPRLSKVAARAGLLESGDPDENWQEIIAVGEKDDASDKAKEKRDFVLGRAVAKTTSQVRGNYLNYTEPETYDDLDATGAAYSEFDRDRLFQVNRVVKDGQNHMLNSGDHNFSNFIRENKETLETLETFKGKTDTAIHALLRPEGITKDGDRIESDAFMEAWHAFDKHTEKKYGNHRYFVAVEDKRVRQTNWVRARFVFKGEKKARKWEDLELIVTDGGKKSGSGGDGSSAGEATGMGEPPTGYKTSEGGVIIPDDIKEEKQKGKGKGKRKNKPRDESEPKKEKESGYREDKSSGPG